MNSRVNNRVGLHIRLGASLLDAAEKAVRLQLPFFQCFFTRQETGTLIQLSNEEREIFLRMYREKFCSLYVHGSYWINLSGVYKNGYPVFMRELELAKRLSFTHMVLHAGSAKGAKNKQQGIDALARMLNTILRYEHSIKLVLENTAHGNMTVGSDLIDFQLLLGKMNHPDKLFFALDTAHAFAYGYDIGSYAGQEAFIALVKETIGIDRVVLIHLNDSLQECGSYIDKHAMPGEGLIGEIMLRSFASHPQLASIPIVLELPIVSEEREITLLHKIGNW